MNLQVANFQICECAQRKDDAWLEEEEITEEVHDAGNGKGISFILGAHLVVKVQE